MSHKRHRNSHPKYCRQHMYLEFFTEMESTLKICIPDEAVKQENRLTADDEHDERCATETLKENEIESAKSQMTHVKEENTRLKMLLEQIESDYKSLQKRFTNIAQQESKKSHGTAITDSEDIEEPELVSLCLGRSPCFPNKDGTTCSSNVNNRDEDEYMKNDLKLGLDCNYRSSKTEVKNDVNTITSLTEIKEDEAGERWPPSKVLKTVRSGDDDELSQTTVKRARVCVRARCDAPTLNDGCQWRKYGQKIAKGNPWPRAYYRCTVAPSCPVRKLVQRCAEDTTILVTTYEGTHNHPLPMSATAMASTTSAAAFMLLSGSRTSQPGFSSSAINHGSLNLKLSDTSKPQSFYLPNSSAQPLTVTLDLTTNTSYSPNHFNMFPLKFPWTNLNFSSPESTMLPSLWSNRHHNYGAQSFNRPPIGLCYQQQYMEKKNQTASQKALAEALTKAMTSDPSIQSVIAAAISSSMHPAS